MKHCNNLFRRLKSKRYKLYTAVLIYLCFTSSYSYAGYFGSLKYYTGVSAGYQYLSFSPNEGQGFLPHNTIDYEFFVGGQSQNTYGFEIGLSATPQVSEYVTLNGGDYYPGATIPLVNGTWMTFQPQYKNTNIYFGLSRYFQLIPRGKLRFFSFVGLAQAKIRIVSNFVADDLGVPDDQEIAASQDVFQASRLITMIRLGIEHNVSQHIGWRMAYTWKNYAAFGKINSLQYPDQPIGISPKNTNAIYFSILIM